MLLVAEGRCAEQGCRRGPRSAASPAPAALRACPLPPLPQNIELTSFGIVHGDSIAELSKALLKFSTLSNHESRQMRLNAMKLFDQQYNVAIIARNLYQCIRSRIN